MDKDILSKETQSNELDKRLTMYELFLILRKKYILVTLLTLFGMGSSIIYALLLPNIYTSKAILILSDSENTSGGNNSMQANAIANLAGLSINGGSSKDKEIITRMNSFHFFESSILPLLKLEDLIAVKNWDSANNRIIYDKSIYNAKLKAWQIPEPTAQAGHRAFIKIFKAGMDELTGFIELSMEHQSPFFAKKSLDHVIQSINTLYKEETQKRSSTSLLFLNDKMARTNSSEIKNSLAFLIQKQTQTLMMTEENENYVVTPIETPFVSEKKSEPNRVLIVIISTLIGLLLGVFISLTTEFYRSEKALSHS